MTTEAEAKPVAAFSETEIETIKKFIGRAVEARWIDGYSEAITGCDDDGITITEFTSSSDYDGGSCLERDTSFVPWIALTDPIEYKRQCDAEEAERKRRWEAERREALASQELRERETLRILQMKYGK